MNRIHRMPFGAECGPDGVRFALWAPSARDVALELDGREFPMPDDGGGWRRLVAADAGPGSRYRFVIDGEHRVPDPASRFQPDDVGGASAVVDPLAYRWRDGNWRGRPWEEAVVYEAHVGTATPEGSWDALAERLADLADLGVTALELMPIAEFPGRRNWGYDGVLPFAPDAAYGEPDALKRLVDRAHGLGLMVLLDVVYNHFGPSGNHLHAYAADFFTDRHATPWGAGLNFDGMRGRPVREFFAHNALYWLEEFHFDGLRLDAVHAIADVCRPDILTELAERVRSAFPDRQVHLVLENDDNTASRLDRDDAGRPRHYAAQWNDDLHHAWHTVLTGETEGYYADYADRPLAHLGRTLAEGFAYQGEPSEHRDGVPRGEPSAHLPPTAFVAFLQNHDQVGNRAFGERMSDLVPEERLALARAALLLAPQPPMLFMGEEWSASTPFLYFVDFADDPGLSAAVRDGRRREFARFAAFADPEHGRTIPDPTAPETFARSKLDWSEAAREPHRTVRAAVRRLLAVRRHAVVPLLRSRFEGADYELPTPYSLDVRWRFRAGHLRFIANFGEAPLTLAGVDAAATLWASDGARFEAGDAVLPIWCGAFFGSAAP